MAIVEIRGQVTHRSLMKKSRHDLAHRVLELSDMLANTGQPTPTDIGDEQREKIRTAMLTWGNGFTLEETIDQVCRIITEGPANPSEKSE